MTGGEFPPVAYPMVDEGDASGLVAAVYEEVLEHFPMVPSLFKSLACNPTYLALAWDQTRHVLETEEFASGADALVEQAGDLVQGRVTTDLRELLTEFEDALSRMLLVAAGLQLALDGTITGHAATPRHGEPAGTPDPERDVPTTEQLDAALVGAIRHDLATPIVNSVWRAAAPRGLDLAAWQEIAAVTHEDWFASACSTLEDTARDNATALSWRTVASPDALREHGVHDAEQAMGALLRAYLTTLPRVLVLVASTAQGT